MYTINNLPEYAKEKAFIVARICDGELWFWGAWDNQEKANEVAYGLENGICLAHCIVAF